MEMTMTEKEIKRTIEQTVKAICGLLDMEVPKISYDTSLFPSETTQALAEVSDTAPPVLYIRPVSFLIPPIALFIGHELRHIYQFYKMDLKDEFRNYKTSKEINIEEYNNQFLELDAHAFGEICMIEFTGARPTWDEFSEELKQKIEKRKQEILKELELEE